MAVAISVKVLHDEATKDLKLFQRQQLPFATSLALNRIAYGAQELTRDITRERFDLASEFIPRNIKVEASKKSDIVRYGLARVVIYTDNKIAFMSLHETGEDKLPRGKALAVVSNLAPEGMKTGQGAMKKRWKPRQLLTPKKGSKVFAAKGMILMRTGTYVGQRQSLSSKKMIKGREELQVIYRFESRAQIEAEWGFESSVRGFVESRYGAYFAKALDDAIRSASRGIAYG